MDRESLHRALLEHLLAAPGDDDGWAQFLLVLCEALGGSTASLIAHDFSSSDTQIAVTARPDPEAIAAYATYWHRSDPWAASPLTPQSASGLVLHGEELIPSSALRRTAFFNEFGRVYGIVRLVGFVEVSRQSLSCLSIVTPAARPPLSDDDRDFLQSLLPAVRRALELHRRLSGAELRTLQSAALLDRLSFAVVFLNRRGAVVSTNRRADEMFRARDGLSCDHGELRGATAGATRQLRRALTDALSRDPIKGGDLVAVSLPKPSGGRSLAVHLAPLPLQRRAFVTDEAEVAMFIADPDSHPLPQPATLRQLLGLTMAEAQLVHCLVRGMSLDQIASHLGLRLQTVRSRLKDIFAKTETHRQASLVRLVLTLGGPLIRK